MYLAIAVNHANEHAEFSDKHGNLTEDGVPETIGVTTSGAAHG
jgi:hypothetical protein